MTAVLFDYPARAAFGKTIPKARIIEHTNARGLRDRLSRELADIRWAFKLAPTSLNLPASDSVPEVQVFRLVLKPGLENAGEATLRAIDQAIPSPILFEVEAADRLRTVAAYKRPNEADASKSVLGEYLWGDWMPAYAARQPLPGALNMAGLYRELLRALIGSPARAGESLRDQLDRLAQVRTAERECARLEALLAREKQFNRKVDIYRALREVTGHLQALRGTAAQ